MAAMRYFRIWSLIHGDFHVGKKCPGVSDTDESGSTESITLSIFSNLKREFDKICGKVHSSKDISR